MTTRVSCDKNKDAQAREICNGKVTYLSKYASQDSQKQSDCCFHTLASDRSLTTPAVAPVISCLNLQMSLLADINKPSGYKQQMCQQFSSLRK